MKNRTVTFPFRSFKDFQKQVNPDRKKLFFEVWQSEYHDFLTFVKSLGCRWRGGDEIDPETDNCWIHMSVSTKKELAFIDMMPWLYMPASRALRLSYHSLTQGILSESVGRVAHLSSHPITDPDEQKRIAELLKSASGNTESQP